MRHRPGSGSPASIGPISTGPGDGPAAPRIALGGHLRRLRESRAISRQQAGYVIRASAAKISRLELGRTAAKEHDVADLLTLYGVTDREARADYLELARLGGAAKWWQPYEQVVPPWFETYLGLEQAASVIRTYELQFVPGLLQTPDYARAVVGLAHQDPTEIDDRVALRLERQELLASRNAPILWAVIDEAALRRPVVPAALWRAQLDHLIAEAERPNIRLQVAPLDRGGHAAAGGSFSLLRFTQPDVPDVVYLEQLTSALYLDRPADVEHYARTMDQLCVQADTVDRSTALLAGIRAEA